MMMRSILGLFTRNPFLEMQHLGQKVKECTDQIPVLFDAFFEGDYDQVRALAEHISHLEHEADVVKTRARDALPRTIFMPVDRRDFIDVISSLDAIADCAEDVGILFTLRKMEPHDELVEPLRALVRRVSAAVEMACRIVERFNVVVDSGFANREVSQLIDMIDELGRLEHEADIVQDDLARRLFAIEEDIKPGSLFIWNKIFNKVGDMANHAEKMGNRLRLFLSK